MLLALLTATALLATSTWAQIPQTAILTISSSHGGAGSGITNNTVTVPLNTRFTNSSALAAVSYLYLTGATGVPLDSVTCQAYQDREATLPGGHPFNSTTPALLSTNTVTVGSVLCTSNFVAMAPPGGNFSTSLSPPPSTSAGNLSSTTRAPTSSSPSSNTAAPMTSVYVTTMSATGNEPATQSTVTSVFVPSGEPSSTPAQESGSAGQPTGSATTSASAGLSTPNLGAGGREIGAEIYAGLAVVGMGVAFAM